jgi:hypothetical protein
MVKTSKRFQEGKRLWILGLTLTRAPRYWVAQGDPERPKKVQVFSVVLSDADQAILNASLREQNLSFQKLARQEAEAVWLSKAAAQESDVITLGGMAYVPALLVPARATMIMEPVAARSAVPAEVKQEIQQIQQVVEETAENLEQHQQDPEAAPLPPLSEKFFIQMQNVQRLLSGTVAPATKRALINVWNAMQDIQKGYLAARAAASSSPRKPSLSPKEKATVEDIKEDIAEARANFQEHEQRKSQGENVESLPPLAKRFGTQVHYIQNLIQNTAAPAVKQGLQNVWKAMMDLRRGYVEARNAEKTRPSYRPSAWPRSENGPFRYSLSMCHNSQEPYSGKSWARFIKKNPGEDIVMFLRRPDVTDESAHTPAGDPELVFRHCLGRSITLQEMAGETAFEWNAGRGEPVTSNVFYKLPLMEDWIDARSYFLLASRRDVLTFGVQYASLQEIGTSRGTKEYIYTLIPLETQDQVEQFLELPPQRRPQRDPTEKGSEPLPHLSLDDAYAFLELSPDASDADIKKAYRRLSLVYHPDKWQESSLASETNFKLLGQALRLVTESRK